MEMIKKLFKGAVTDKTDDTLTAFATVEVKDREGDIIRVAGFEMDHSPQSSLKVYGTTHGYKSLPNGDPPIIGVIKDYAKITTDVGGKPVPAVAFEMAWAKGEGGELTDFARKMKGLFDASTLDAFSVGIHVEKHIPLRGGRHDVVKSRCFEISASPLPVNKYATVIKSWKAALGDDADADEILEDRLIVLQKSIDQRSEFDSAIMQRFDALESSLTTLLKGAARPPRGATEQASQEEQLLANVRKLLQGN